MEIRGLCPPPLYDMTASLRFDRDVPGCAIVSTSPMLGEDRYHWVWLRLGGAKLMLNTAYEFGDQDIQPVR